MRGVVQARAARPHLRRILQRLRQAPRLLLEVHRVHAVAPEVAPIRVWPGDPHLGARVEVGGRRAVHVVHAAFHGLVHGLQCGEKGLSAWRAMGGC